MGTVRNNPFFLKYFDSCFYLFVSVKKKVTFSLWLYISKFTTFPVFFTIFAFNPVFSLQKQLAMEQVATSGGDRGLGARFGAEGK
ncbi:hypothetical protein V6Z11_A11G332200 [Gossypium hirsutum]